VEIILIEINGVVSMENILQLNSRKGIVKFSEKDMAEYDLLKWVRVSFKGIGKAGIIDDIPFETKAADLYVKKYLDTQVILAERVIYNKEDNSVSVFLKTTSTPENRYYNEHNTALVYSEKEIKKASTFKKKKFSASVSPEYGKHVQRVVKVDSEDPSEHNYKLSISGDILAVKTNDKQQPIITEWPDVKGVPLYVNDIALLISDFSGGVDNTAIRSIVLPPYSQIAPVKELLLKSKGQQADFDSSLSRTDDLSPKGIYSDTIDAKTYNELDKFKKTMILLGLESTDKSSVDFNQIYIDKETWDAKYKDIIKEEFNGFEVDSYDEFISTISQAASSEWDSNEYELGSSLASTLSNNLDFKDVYVPNITGSDKKKDLKTITPTNTFAYILPEELNNTLKDSLSDDDNINFADFAENLSKENEEVKINYDYLRNKIQEDTLSKEINFLTAQVDLYTTKNSQSKPLDSDDVSSIREYVESIYNSITNENKDKIEELVSLLTTYCSFFNDINDGFNSYRDARVKRLARADNSSSTTMKSLLSSLAFDDINTPFEPQNHSQVIGLKGIKLILNNLPGLITGNQKKSFDEKPFGTLLNHLHSYERTITTKDPKVYIPFTSLNKSEKQISLDNIGVVKAPISIGEFFSRVLNDPIDINETRKNFTDSSNADLFDKSGPDSAERRYTQLIKSSWDSASAAEKEERLSKAYGEDFVTNPDFDTTLFKGRTPERDDKYKKLLAFHRYLADNEIYDNVTELGAGGPAKFDPKVKELYNQFMSQFSQGKDKPQGQEEVQKYKKEIEGLKVGLSNLKETDPNYQTRKKENEDLIKFYTDKISSANLEGLSNIPSFKEYEDFISKQTTSNTNVYDTRELIKIIGFAIGDSPEAIGDYKNLKTFVKEHGLANLNIDESEIDEYVDSMIGDLQLENIKNILIRTIYTGEESDFIDYSSEALSYTALRKTYEQILTKVGMSLSSITFDTFEDLINTLVSSKNAEKLITNQELNKLIRLKEKISSYVNFYMQQYEEYITEEQTSLVNELAQYKDYISTLSPDNPEYKEYQDAIRAIEQDLAESQKSSSQNELELKTNLLQTLPEDLLAFISMSASNPNVTIENIDQFASKHKTAAFPIELDVNQVLQKLNEPELKVYYDKLTMNKSTDASSQVVMQEINQLAEKVQKTLIDEFIENNTEIFGEDFTENVGSSFGSGDTWIIGQMVTGSVTGKAGSSVVVGDMIACTTDQVLKVSPDKIDQFYNKYKTEVAKSQNKPVSDEDLNYFKSEEDKDAYTKNNYTPAINDYRKTEDSLRGSKILDAEKSKDSPTDRGLLSTNKPEVSVSDQAQFSKLDSLKNEKSRIENKLHNQIPVNFYNKKVTEKERDVQEAEDNKKALEQELSSFTADKKTSDPVALKEIEDKIKIFSDKMLSDQKELNLYKEELIKATNKEKWHKNKINSIDKKIRELQSTLNSVKDSDIEKQEFYLNKANVAISDIQNRIKETTDPAEKQRLQEVLDKQVNQKSIIEKRLHDLQNKADKAVPVTGKGTELKNLEKKIQEIKSSKEYKEAVERFNKEYVVKKKAIESNTDLDDMDKEIELSSLNDQYKSLLTTAKGFVKQLKDLNSERDTLIDATSKGVEKETKGDPVAEAPKQTDKKKSVKEVKDIVTKDFLSNLHFKNKADAVNFFNNSRTAQSFLSEHFEDGNAGFALKSDKDSIDEAIIADFNDIIADFLLADMNELTWKDLEHKWSLVLDNNSEIMKKLKGLYDTIKSEDQKEKQAFHELVKSHVRFASINKALFNIEEVLVNTHIKKACEISLKGPVFDSVENDKAIKEKADAFNKRKVATEMFDANADIEKYEDELIDQIDVALNEFRDLHKDDNMTHEQEEEKEDTILNTVQTIVDELFDLHSSYEKNSYEQNSNKDFTSKGRNFDSSKGTKDPSTLFNKEINSFDQMVNEHYNKLSKFESGKSLLNDNQQTDTEQFDGAVSDDPAHKTLAPSNATMLSKRTSSLDYEDDDNIQYDRDKIILNIKKEISSLENKVQEIYNKDANTIEEEDMLWLDYYTTLNEELRILENEKSYED